MHTLTLSLLTALLLPQAERPHQGSPLLSHAAVTAPRLLVDQSVDGTVWARGVDYKVALSRDGARFIPRERHARSLNALTLGVAEIGVGGARVPIDRLAAPALDGERVTYERGPLTELWELAPHGARQSFVLGAPLGEGDVEVRLALGGDLVPAASRAADGGLVFESPAGGLVSYGDILAFDSAGRAWRGPSRLEGSAIVLRVPGAFLVGAAYPVVIDPLVSTIAYDGGADDPSIPDIAVDQSTGRLLVVFEDTFASSDTDIVARRFTTAGAFLDEVAVDISDEETIDPSVACNEAANQFLTAWIRTGEGLFTTRRVEARTRSATSTSQGAELGLSFGQGNESTPDVGGTTFGASNSPYFVVWSERGIATGQNIRGRSVSPSGVLGNGLTIDGGFGDQLLPTISKDNGAALRWGVAYQKDLLGDESEVHFAGIESAGTVVDDFPDFFFEGFGDNSRPDVAGDGETFVAVFQQRRAQGDHDIGKLIVSYQPGAVVLSFGDVTAVELGATVSRHQTAPAVARVGNGFVCAYQEALTTSTSAFDVFLVPLDDAGSPLPTEGHVLASPSSPGFDGTANICAFSNGTRAFPVWVKVDSAGDRDVNGAFYDHP